MLFQFCRWVNERVFLYFLITCIIIACAGPRSAWERAGSIDTKAAYEDFLANYPHTEFSSEAKAKIENIRWKNASTVNTIQGYREFLRQYPDSERRATINARINEKRRAKEEKRWAKAWKIGTEEALLDFLAAYPETEKASKAF